MYSLVLHKHKRETVSTSLKSKSEIVFQINFVVICGICFVDMKKFVGSNISAFIESDE